MPEAFCLAGGPAYAHDSPHATKFSYLVIRHLGIKSFNISALRPHLRDIKPLGQEWRRKIVQKRFQPTDCVRIQLWKANDQNDVDKECRTKEHGIFIKEGTNIHQRCDEN